MCDTYMGEIGEEDIYQAYKKNPKSTQQFENFLCRGPGVRGECQRFEEENTEANKPSQKKKKKKKAKKEEL